MPLLSHLPILSYEIHLSEEVRRKGLGKFLMQTLELLAARYVPHGHRDVCLQFHSVAAAQHVVLCTSRVVGFLLFASFDFMQPCYVAFPEQR